MTELWQRDAGWICAEMAARRLSPVEVMRETLGRIDAVNPAVNAVVSLLDRETLMGAARVAEALDPVGPLHGLPIAIKDLVATKGVVSTWGAPFLRAFRPTEDDAMAARLRGAGAIVIGKTNVPQFGFGSHSTNPVFGATRNPHDPSRTAGGSSGGAAAALATGMLSVADGSDKMGSLRNPAAWCDVYGMRPTEGTVQGSGIPSVIETRLSTRGPMARSIADLQLLLGVLGGNVAGSAGAGQKAPRVGWLGDWDGAYGFEPGLLDLSETALGVMEDLGWAVTPVAAPMSAASLWQSWTDLRSFSIALDLAPHLRNPAERADLVPQVIWEIERGLALDVTAVEAAATLRRTWLARLERLFETVDVLVLPSTQVWPFPVDWDWPREINGVPMDTYHRWMEVVVPASLAGLPVINLPAGFGDAGLPGGVQLIGRAGADAQLLDWAKAYEAAIGPRRIVTPVARA